jgi:hypothetical protein
MFRDTRVVVVLALGLALGTGTRPADGFQDMIGSNYEVRLVGWERLAPNFDSYRFTIDIRDAVRGKEKAVEIQNASTTIESGEIVGDELVLIGDAGGHGKTISIVDLRNGALKDWFLCRQPTVVKSRRTVFFVGYYPSHGLSATYSDVVGAYDLDLSAEDNRLGSVNGNALGRQGVGLPLFPEENVSSRSWAVWIPDEPERHSVLGPPLLWISSSQRLAFIDHFRGDTWLVAVSLEAGLKSPEIARTKIDVATILAQSPGSKGYEDLLRLHRRTLAVESLAATSDGRVSLLLNRQMFDSGVFRFTGLAMEVPGDGVSEGALKEEPGGP